MKPVYCCFVVELLVVRPPVFYRYCSHYNGVVERVSELLSVLFYGDRPVHFLTVDASHPVRPRVTRLPASSATTHFPEIVKNSVVGLVADLVVGLVDPIGLTGLTGLGMGSEVDYFVVVYRRVRTHILTRILPTPACGHDNYIVVFRYCRGRNF